MNHQWRIAFASMVILAAVTAIALRGDDVLDPCEGSSDADSTESCEQAAGGDTPMESVVDPQVGDTVEPVVPAVDVTPGSAVAPPVEVTVLPTEVTVDPVEPAVGMTPGSADDPSVDVKADEAPGAVDDPPVEVKDQETPGSAEDVATEVTPGSVDDPPAEVTVAPVEVRPQTADVFPEGYEGDLSSDMVQIEVVDPMPTVVPPGDWSPSLIFHVSESGDDGNDGSSAAPWATISHALEQVPTSGDALIWVWPGVFDEQVEATTDFTSEVRVVAVTPYRSHITHAQNPVVSIKSENLRLEGFEISGQPSSSTGDGLVYMHKAHRSSLRNNVIHDSYDNDILRILRSDDVVVSGNLLYNPGPGEHTIDINGGSQRTIVEDNIMFSDHAGSGRPASDALAFIVVKFSGGEQTTGGTVIRRNIFTHYEGDQQALKIGSDGELFFEAVDVTIENNLFHFYGPPADGAFRVIDAAGISFRANTFVGDDTDAPFVGWVGTADGSPPSEDVEFMGNIFVSPGGVMGDRLIDSDRELITSGSISHNVYWNGGGPIPEVAGDRFNYTADDDRVVDDPLISSAAVTLPRWTGSGFGGSHVTIRDAFVDYVRRHATPARTSPAGDLGYVGAPSDDILGNPRTGAADAGAVEFRN